MLRTSTLPGGEGYYTDFELTNYLMKKILFLLSVFLTNSCIGNPKIPRDLKPQIGNSIGVMTYFSDGVYSQHYEIDNGLDLVKSMFGIEKGHSIWHKKFESNARATNWTPSRFAQEVAGAYIRKHKFVEIDIAYDRNLLIKHSNVSLLGAIETTKVAGQAIPDFYLVLVQQQTSLPDDSWFRKSEVKIAGHDHLLDSGATLNKRLVAASQTRFLNFQNKFGFTLIHMTKPLTLGKKNRADFFCGTSFDIYLYNNKQNRLVAYIPAYESSEIYKINLSYDEYLEKSFRRFLFDKEDVIRDGCLRGLARGIFGNLEKIF